MDKFTNNQKLEVVWRYQYGSESVNAISKSIHANVSFVRNWIKQFEYHGLAAFEKSYTTYTGDFKMDVLNYMNENGVSSNEAAVIFNIPSPRLIRKWGNQLKIGEYDTLF